MTTAFLAPAPINNTFFLPGSNTPGSGVQLFLYVAGSVSTKQTAYQDGAASTPWANPIVLDSGGNLPTGTKEVWFVSGQNYKAVYAPSNDTDPPTSPLLTLDNLSGMNDVSGSISEWQAGPTPTFSSGTLFSVAGDQTLVFTLGRRIKATVTAGTVYGTIVNTIFTAGNTNVTVRLDSGALDSGLSAVSYGLLQATNPSIPSTTLEQPTQTVTASSTTLNLASTAARSIIVSSTNPVSTMPIADGQIKFLEFASALTLFHNATTFPLSGGANISTAAGDTAIMRGESGLTRMLMYGPPKVGAKTVSFTRDTSLASGTQAVTGVGFIPRAVILLAGLNTGTAQVSVGMDEGVTPACMFNNSNNTADTWGITASQSITFIQSGAAVYEGKISAFGADGFTITWTKTGTPTGTNTVVALCFR